MSFLSSILCMLTLMAFSSFLPCCAWQTQSTLSLLLSPKLTHRHFRGQASSSAVRLNYRAGGGGGRAGDSVEVGEGAYYDTTMDQVFTGYQQHYDPLVGGNHLNDGNQGRKSRPTNGMNSFGPDAWESSSSSSSTRRDHVTIGPGSANSHEQSRRPSTFWPSKSTFARHPHQQYGNDRNHNHHRRRHVSADDHLPQDSFRHQDSANLRGDRRPFNQQQQPYTSWSPRAPSHMSFFDHVHREGEGEMLPDHRSRIDRSDARTTSRRLWNPRRQAKSFRLGSDGGGLSGPISSQAFQEGMDTHTTLGPLPDHDVRRRFLLEARQKQAQEDWVGGFDGRGNVLWNRAQQQQPQQQEQQYHRRHHDLDEEDEYFQQQHHAQHVAVHREEDSSYFGHEMEDRRGYY